MTDPFDLLEQVTDRESFLAFVRALAADREDEVAKEQVQPSSPYGPGANGWENATIEAFLEAALAWAHDFFFQAMGTVPLRFTSADAAEQAAD